MTLSVNSTLDLLPGLPTTMAVPQDSTRLKEKVPKTPGRLHDPTTGHNLRQDQTMQMKIVGWAERSNYGWKLNHVVSQYSSTRSK